jgi:nucleotide-binding universal stress UspA family protein
MEAPKFNKVLIALDYFPTALKVAEIGFELAQSIGAKVCMLHVIANSSCYEESKYTEAAKELGLSPSEISHLLDKGLDVAMESYLEKIKLSLGSHDIQTLILKGEASSSILKAAADQKADIIVVGSLSHRWEDNISMGRITGNIFKNSHLPVFIVPTKK